MNPESGILKQSVRERVRTAVLAPSADPTLPAFTRYFRERFGPQLLAVILYGSCLSSLTRRESSIYDFFLICDRYRHFYRDRKLALFNYCLPPNIFYFELTDPSFGRLAGKYSVTSLRDFRQETSSRAHDNYHLGRFAKRVVIAFTREERVREELIDAILSAMEQNIRLALPCLPGRFQRDEFVRTLLGMSYRGETRVDVDTKVEELFQAESEYYRQSYGELLLAYLQERKIGTEADGGYSLPENSFLRGYHRIWVRARLFKTRIRTYLRWPKYIITFDNWLDYLLSKLERSKGIRLELNERERKYPLIFAWKHFFRLKRAGKIR